MFFFFSLCDLEFLLSLKVETNRKYTQVQLNTDASKTKVH